MQSNLGLRNTHHLCFITPPAPALPRTKSKREWFNHKLWKANMWTREEAYVLFLLRDVLESIRKKTPTGELVSFPHLSVLWVEGWLRYPWNFPPAQKDCGSSTTQFILQSSCLIWLLLNPRAEKVHFLNTSENIILHSAFLDFFSSILIDASYSTGDNSSIALYCMVSRTGTL